MLVGRASLHGMAPRWEARGAEHEAARHLLRVGDAGRSALYRAGARGGADAGRARDRRGLRSEEHTSELQSLMRISYAVFCLKKKNKTKSLTNHTLHKSEQSVYITYTTRQY